MATLEELARQFAARYPKPSLHPFGGASTWDQWCGSLMNRMCAAHGVAPTGDIRSAWIVWKRTPTAGTDPSKAPIGAFHFWEIGGYLAGHVGLDLRGGGSHVFMATYSVRESLGVGLGIQSVAGYTAAKNGRARYVGWTNTYANGDVTKFTLPPAPAAPVIVKKPLPVGSLGPVLRSGKDWAYRRPQGELAKRVARALIARKRLPSSYKNDGYPGPVFDRAVQRTLNVSGVFPGVEDGVIERGGSYGVQDYGRKHGSYTGKRDGRPEVLSWAAFALGLERR